ncbi:MAG: peptidoglycan-binding protein [Actinomycetales bacterium]|nr:peptidoglycan-binding protein [Actinomycetales bacterium]
MNISPRRRTASPQLPGTDDTPGAQAFLSTARRRRRLVTGVALVAAGALAGGLLAGALVKSPAQLAAEARPPTPSLVTAEVQERVVTSTVVARGTVGVTRHYRATPTGGAEGAGPLVVTRLPARPGARIRAGQVLVEVSGRPVVALKGAVPAYRDLVPGAEGRDVTQLQSALRALGHPTGADPRGRFGQGTARALTALYRGLGYNVRTTSGYDDPQQDPKVQAAQDAVTAARRTLDELLDPPATEEPGDASAAGGGSAGGSTGSAASHDRAVANAREDLATARSRYRALLSTSGPMLPVGEVLFVPSFPATLLKIKGTVGDRVQAPLVDVAAGPLIVTGELDAADSRLVRDGMRVTVDDELTGLSVTGTVEEVSPGTDGTARARLTVLPDDPLPRRVLDHDVRLTVEAARSDGKVLAVPVSAVSASADGSAYLTRIGPDGSTSRVEVETGVSGQGHVEVSGDGLAAGDQVVVGR